MILGRVEDEQEFSDLVYEIWVKNPDESQRRKAFDLLGARLQRARQAYEESKSWTGKSLARISGYERRRRPGALIFLRTGPRKAWRAGGAAGRISPFPCCPDRWPVVGASGGSPPGRRGVSSSVRSPVLDKLIHLATREVPVVYGQAEVSYLRRKASKNSWSRTFASRTGRFAWSTGLRPARRTCC